MVLVNVIIHVSLLLCVGMIIVVARSSQSSQIGTAFLVLLTFMAIWSIGTILELDVRLMTGISYLPLIYVSYIGICLAPVAILQLGKITLQPDWHPKLIHALFLVVPIISIVLVFTNSYHHLFFINFSLESAKAVYGPYYYFHSLYSYSLIAVGIIWMLMSSVRNTGLFSKQSLLVAVGILITVIPNVLYSFGLLDLPFNISIVALSVSVLCCAVAFLKFRFLSSVPITMRQVVDLISDGYLVLDRQMYILTYNNALLRLLSEPSNIALGSNLGEFIEHYFTDFSFEQFLELQVQAIKQRATLSAEVLLAKDRYVNMEITPVMQRNTYTGSVILLKDITQSKLLIEASKAESQYKSVFLSNMSHEIRTPLNAIIGMVDIGKSAGEIERKDYCLNRIEDASEHLLGIINDILDISKIESGKFELVPEEFVFERMIERVLNVVKTRADEKQQTLTVHTDAAIPYSLIGDDQRIAQVITNLIGNAIKFTPEKGKIGLNTTFMAEDNGVCTLQFSVSDTGIGISAHQQSLLFKSFTQAESNISRKFGGTGLGLSISKSVVEMMNGHIWVDSELNKGATFSFTIQAARGKGEFAKQPAEQETTDLSDIFLGRTILLVEDMQVNREIVMALLEVTGVSVDCAENGAVAVSMFKVSPDKYELIFMDVQMPEMDGYEATRAIRALDIPEAQSVAIVAMTANVFREDVERCLEAGMNGHIGKPLSFNDIYQQLKKYL